jgi:hypothetical protein
MTERKPASCGSRSRWRTALAEPLGEIELDHVAVRPAGLQHHQILDPVRRERLEQAFGQARRAGDPDVEHR